MAAPRTAARPTWLPVAAALAVLTACAGYALLVFLGVVTAPPLVHRPNEQFRTLTLTRSGGEGGGLRTIAVRPSGSYQVTVSDSERDRRTAGRLTPARLAALRQLVTSRQLAAEGRQPAWYPPTATRCSDTFHYRLRMASLIVAGDECDGVDLGRPQLARLVQLLSATLAN
ncbi:MAG: hypothetical protein M3042_05760 [Actinomycetota bacterium]|nr:hypothetical protein [Actinomycetota bacterium]